MSKTKILIILGAVAGLILVVGLAVGLTHQSKTSDIKSNITGQDEINDPGQITEFSTGVPSRTEKPEVVTGSTLLQGITTQSQRDNHETTTISNQTLTPQSVEDKWGQWSNWTPCSQYCRQARMRSCTGKTENCEDGLPVEEQKCCELQGNKISLVTNLLRTRIGLNDRLYLDRYAKIHDKFPQDDPMFGIWKVYPSNVADIINSSQAKDFLKSNIKRVCCSSKDCPTWNGLMKATDATSMLMFLSTNPCASAVTFVTYLRFSESINSERVLMNADINGQRQKLSIAGFSLNQIQNILDDETEVMKEKCKNSAIDFLFVLDGSGDRNDDSKWRKMTSLIADKWIDIITPNSKSRVAGRFFNDDYSQYEDILGSGDYSQYSDRSQDFFLDFESSQEKIKFAFAQSDFYGGSRATGTALERVFFEDVPKMSSSIRHVITFILGNSNGGQSVSQAAPKLKSSVEKVFAVGIGGGATDDMKLIASGSSSQINVPDMSLLGEFIRDFVLLHGGCNA